MRLLIITQKVDELDAVLGFMHGWVAEFSRQVEKVSVICLEKGLTNLPANVKVFSLGKESYKLRTTNYKLFEKLKYACRFLRYIVRLRQEYDAVFAHMNPEYVVLGGWFWKLSGKTVTLWYAHKSTPWYLRLAHLFVDTVFTSTASGFRLQSKKVRIIGQGIDVSRFKIQESRIKNENGGKTFKIVTAGRITPSKDYGTLIDAVAMVHKATAVPIEVAIIGPTSFASDETYLSCLKEEVVRRGLAGIVTFHGPVANAELPETLVGYDLFVNMGLTGSLDKAVPEAMAVGLPVLTCNEAFNDVLGHFKADLMYPKGDWEALASKILKVIGLTEEERYGLGGELRAIVARDHSLESFIRKIVSGMQSF